MKVECLGIISVEDDIYSWKCITHSTLTHKKTNVHNNYYPALGENDRGSSGTNESICPIPQIQL